MYIVLIILLIAAAVYFLTRKKSTSVILPPEAYEKLLEDEVEYYRNLEPSGKSTFISLVSEFLKDTTIEGVGTEVTSLDRVLIASSAVIPIFGFPEWKYKNLTNVILYPDTFDHDFQFEGGDRNILGMVGSGYMNGQMILSRAALVKGFSKSAGQENTAIHEFVHLLDNQTELQMGFPKT